MASPFTIKSAKANFFDRARVIRAVDPAKRRALSAAGASVRKYAKRSMEQSKKDNRIPEASLPEDVRRRRQIANKIRAAEGRKRLKPRVAHSQPGQAPAAGRTSPLNRLLFFAFDNRTESVVIGPVGFAKSRVPAVLEYGGRTRGSSGRMVKIAERPAMRPALRTGIDSGEVTKRWKNSVRGAA